MAVILLALASGAAIAAGGAESAESPATIDPVFDCYAANSAWGLSYSGKVVGRDGRVWTYDRRGRMLPIAIGEGGQHYLRASDLAAKFAGARAAGRIDAAALAAHAALIAKAGAGAIRRIDTGVRDAGSSTCHGYVFDAAKRRYRDVELGSDGGAADVRIVNEAPEASALLDWLRSIAVAK